MEYCDHFHDGCHCVCGDIMEGARGGGLWRIFVRFVAAMMIWWVWVSAGVLHFVEKKSTVSDIL
jgi:hypothetical protein